MSDPLPRPPNVPLLRAVWSLLDAIWGVLKGSWGVLVGSVFLTLILEFQCVQRCCRAFKSRGGGSKKQISAKQRQIEDGHFILFM